MPIYTYKCEACGAEIERHQGFHDQPLSTCPECNKESLRKVFAPVGVVFKGSGWYATDHRSPSGTSRASKGENADSSNGNSASTDKVSPAKNE